MRVFWPQVGHVTTFGSLISSIHTSPIQKPVKLASSPRLELFEDGSDNSIEQVGRGVDAEPDHLVEVEAFVRRIGGHAQGNLWSSTRVRECI
jgi:hypothetical protein